MVTRLRGRARKKTSSVQSASTNVDVPEWFIKLTPSADLSMTTLSTKMDVISGKNPVSMTMGLEGRIDWSLGVRDMIGAWLKWYWIRGDYQLFARRWKYARCLMGLQTRLLVEQVLWELGNPWKRLVTGFGAI